MVIFFSVDIYIFVLVLQVKFLIVLSVSIVLYSWVLRAIFAVILSLLYNLATTSVILLLIKSPVTSAFFWNSLCDVLNESAATLVTPYFLALSRSFNQPSSPTFTAYVSS